MADGDDDKLADPIGLVIIIKLVQLPSANWRAGRGTGR